MFLCLYSNRERPASCSDSLSWRISELRLHAAWFDKNTVSSCSSFSFTSGPSSCTGRDTFNQDIGSRVQLPLFSLPYVSSSTRSLMKRCCCCALYKMCLFSLFAEWNYHIHSISPACRVKSWSWSITIFPLSALRSSGDQPYLHFKSIVACWSNGMATYSSNYEPSFIYRIIFQWVGL